MNPTDERAWASDEFSRTRLGDKRRTKRAVKMAEAAARSPAGRVSEAITGVAEREGAYRLLEHEAVSAGELVRSASMACADRAAPFEFVYVPVDQTSLNLPDLQGTRGLGAIGDGKSRARGLQVMNAIAVAPDGTPLGLFGQTYWIRPPGPAIHKTRRKRKLEQKETRYWLQTIEAGISAWNAAQSKTRLWFQLDRGGDFRDMLQWARDHEHWVTVRASVDRRTVDSDERYLWAELEATEPLGTYQLSVPKRGQRPAREAVIEVRLKRVNLLLRDRQRGTSQQAELTAVLAREISQPSQEGESIEWLLLTNKLVNDMAGAREVIFGYSRRWRAEEFHKTWKSVCRVEDTQLRDVQAITSWAAILAAVAMRIQRLTHLARTAPDTPADEELNRYEIEALIRLKKPAKFKPGDIPPISIVIRWLAEIGGYTGRSSGGPPGAIVLARGLDRIQLAAQVLANL